MVILIITKASLKSAVVPIFSQSNYSLNIDPKIKTYKHVRYFLKNTLPINFINLLMQQINFNYYIN